jgi:hypothetical protein
LDRPDIWAEIESLPTVDGSFEPFLRIKAKNHGLDPDAFIRAVRERRKAHDKTLGTESEAAIMEEHYRYDEYKAYGGPRPPKLERHDFDTEQVPLSRYPASAQTQAPLAGTYDVSDEGLVKSLLGFISSFATVNGIRLHYVAGGKGSPVLLLPGWPETWWAYHKIMPDLAKRHRVIVVDLRGMGVPINLPVAMKRRAWRVISPRWSISLDMRKWMWSGTTSALWWRSAWPPTTLTRCKSWSCWMSCTRRLSI